MARARHRTTSTSASPPYGERLRDFGSLVLLLWVIEAIDRLFFANTLEQFGIHPRSVTHFEGLLFAPFLHADWGHLLGNSISLLVLGSVMLASGWRELVSVSLLSMVSGGLVVWLIGQPGTNHIGASSLVFGYLAFLLASGFYRPSPGSISIALLIIFFYGGSLVGLFPTETVRAAGISWEAHLGGAIGGFLAARRYRRKFASHFRSGIS